MANVHAVSVGEHVPPHVLLSIRRLLNTDLHISCMNPLATHW